MCVKREGGKKEVGFDQCPVHMYGNITLKSINTYNEYMLSFFKKG
jgi:hypothetical protein